MFYEKHVKIGALNLFFKWGWGNTWIACVIAIIVYYSSWEMGALALLSHLVIERN